jgi:predicted lipoprotein with Yx(FWY)xxD motif
MRRRRVLLVGLVVAALGSGSAAGAASGATVELHSTGGVYGYEFLVDSGGYTLYTFTKDKGSTTKKSRERCQRIKGCTEGWPPFVVTETPTAGPGVNPMLLSTITLRNGSKQATYAGRPLYTNAGDGPFEIYYFGVREFRGRWYGLNALGGTL